MRSRAILACLLVLVSSAASAIGEIDSLITNADRARLAKFDAAKREGLAEARRGGEPADVAVLHEVMARPPVGFSDFDMTGSWQCRTIKAGGPAELVVYPWFRCRVTDDGSGWRLEKLTGSQRTIGRFFTESDTSLTYLGAFFIAGETPPPYDAGPESDQVGRTFRGGANRWRIEFPWPHYESKFDILELKR